MVRAEGRGRAGTLFALVVIAFAACVPGALTLGAGDASTPGDGPSGLSDGGAEGGTDGGVDVGADSGAGGDAGNGNDSTAPDTGSAGDAGSPTGCTCVPPWPAGWGPVAVYFAARSSCPAGYGTPSDVIIDPSDLGPSTCSCGPCNITPPSCTSGTFQLAYGTGVCDAGGGSFPENGGACVAGSFPFAAADHMIDGSAPSGGSCTAPLDASAPSPGGNEGKACYFTGQLGAGCSGNELCAPTVETPFVMCIQRAGPQTCPPEYPQMHATGTGITPGCTPCSCSVSATCQGELTVYGDSACQTALVSVASDGVCHSTPQGAAGESYLYTAQATNVSCSAQSTPSDSSLSGLVTVCCQ